METNDIVIVESRWTNPNVSKFLMFATYAVGGLGYFVGFLKMNSDGAEAAVAPVALLSVGFVGIISMFRHSVFHRSDAVRMGWDLGGRNNFQLEVGFINFAVGLPAIAAVMFDWGVAVEAAFVLAYALYFIQVVMLVIIDREDGKINVTRILLFLMQTGLLFYFALSALAAANIRPF